MKSLLVLALLGLFASSASAEAPLENFEILSTSTPQGLALYSGREDVGMALTLIAPDESRVMSTYKAHETIYIDVGNGAMPDGLYSFEIRPVLQIQREPGSIPDNLRGLVDDGAPRIDPYFGSFRIVGGKLVDSMDTELTGTVKEVTK